MYLIIFYIHSKNDFNSLMNVGVLPGVTGTLDPLHEVRKLAV